VHYLIFQSRVKPKGGILELDYALKTEDKFYDKLVGEKFGTTKQGSKDAPKQNVQPRFDFSKYVESIILIRISYELFITAKNRWIE